MAEFVVFAGGKPCGFPELVAAASRDLEGMADEDLGGFLGRAGRPTAGLVVRGVGVCTGFQPEVSSHTDLMVEAAASGAPCEESDADGVRSGGVSR